MKNIILLVASLILSINSFAQDVSWGFYLDGQKNYAQKVATDYAGNIFVLGETAGYNVDFDPGIGITLAGEDASLLPRFYIAKYSENGAFLWVKMLAEKVRYLQEVLYIDTDNLGNVYIAGSFRGAAVDFDPGANEFIMGTSGSNDYDAFVQKLDVNGNFVFAKRISGPGSTALRDLVVKGTSIYFACDFEGFNAWDGVTETGLSTNCAVVQWSTSGAIVANRYYNTVNGRAIALAVDNDLNIYVTGYFTGAFSGASTAINANGTDIYIVKYGNTSSLTNALWVKGIGGSAVDKPTAFVVDGNNNITLGLQYSSTAPIDVDPGVGVVNHDAIASNPNGYTIKTILVNLDEDGNYVWSNELVNSNGYVVLNDLNVDSDNNIYSNGYMENAGSVDFDFSSNSVILSPLSSQAQSWIQKIDENGIYQTAFINAGGYFYMGKNSDFYLAGIIDNTPKPFGTIANPFSLEPTNLIDYTSYLVKYEQCSIDATTSVAGTTITATSATGTYQWIDCDNNNAEINGATAQTFSPTVSGNYAVEISTTNCTVTSACTSVIVASAGIDEQTANNFNIYPNPASSSISINNLKIGSTLQLTDMTGKTVFETVVSSSEMTFDVNNLNNGIYFVQLMNNSEVSTSKKLVVSK